MKTITKQEFAILYTQQSLVFEIARNTGFKGAIADSHRKFSKFVDSQSKLVEGAKDISINGSYNDNESYESSHYDIEDALIKKFGKENINPDSHSDGFHVDVTSDNKDKVVAFLKKKFPNLEFEVEENENPLVFSNWTEAIQLCKDNNITVELPKDYITDDMLSFDAKINAKKDELARVQKELDELIGQ